MKKIGLEIFLKFYLAAHWNSEKSSFSYSYIVHLNSLVYDLAKFYTVHNISNVSKYPQQKNAYFARTPVMVEANIRVRKVENTDALYSFLPSLTC